MEYENKSSVGGTTTEISHEMRPVPEKPSNEMEIPVNHEGSPVGDFKAAGSRMSDIKNLRSKNEKSLNDKGPARNLITHLPAGVNPHGQNS